MCTPLLPPANEVCEGYVFTGVCLSTVGGSTWAGIPPGICNLVPGNQIAPLREKRRKVIDSVIKAKIMGLLTPGG